MGKLQIFQLPKENSTFLSFISIIKTIYGQVTFFQTSFFACCIALPILCNK